MPADSSHLTYLQTAHLPGLKPKEANLQLLKKSKRNLHQDSSLCYKTPQTLPQTHTCCVTQVPVPHGDESSLLHKAALLLKARPEGIYFFQNKAKQAFTLSYCYVQLPFFLLSALRKLRLMLLNVFNEARRQFGFQCFYSQ